MGVIISVVNNKGGCGKTTTTCNLADALGKRGKKVLVVDMDSQCNATSKLKPDKTTIRKSLYELIDPEEKNTHVNECIYPTEIKKVSLLPNISLTANLEPDIIMNAPDSFLKIKNILKPYAIKEFDFTIIDNPPNMGAFVLCSLNASDFVIVPVEAGSTDSVEGLVKATNLIQNMQQNDSDLKFLRILINGLDKRTAISKIVTDQIINSFDKDDIFETMIPVNTAFQKAEALNTTIFEAEATSPGARAFRSLASEFIKIMEGMGYE